MRNFEIPTTLAEPVRDATADRAVTPVPFFSQADSFIKQWPTIVDEVNSVFARGKFSHGRKVEEFEHSIADFTGARFAIGVNSGTDALVLLMRAAGIGAGDEVIVPAFSFAATATSVVLAGATPKFADISDAGDYALDVASCEFSVGSNTAAVMPAHLFHQLADLGALGDFATRHAIALVEDSAESIGMYWGETHSGLLGLGGVLSFFPTKTLGALGDAGMIITDDATVAKAASTLRHHGRMGRTIDHIAGISNLSGASGTNSKMDDIQAAILSAKLQGIGSDIARRELLAAKYSERLMGIDGITRLPRRVDRQVSTSSVFYVYVIEVDARDLLVQHLTDAGIGTEVYYPSPLHLQPCFESYGHRRGEFPNAEAACARTVALPLYPDMSEDSIDIVCDAIRNFYLDRSVGS